MLNRIYAGDCNKFFEVVHTVRPLADKVIEARVVCMLRSVVTARASAF